MSKVTKFTKEDDALLSTYSPAVSAKGSAIFYINALITSVAPAYLFVGVNQIEIADSWLPLLFAVLSSAYGISFASKNFKHLLKHKIVLKRAEAVTREINRKYADDKKMTKKEKDERVLYRRNEVADEESTYLAVFISNALYIFGTLLLGFVLFANLTPIFSNDNATEPRMQRNGFLPGHHGKINRIPLKGTALVEVLSVHSPSLVWCRITNHITERLTVVEPAEMKELGDEECVEWGYCMALVSSRKFGRARILKIDRAAQRVQVLFIDEGFVATVSRNSLASMRDSPPCETFVYHPWQAMAVTLADILPANGSTWPRAVCTELRQIIDHFDYCKIVAMLASKTKNVNDTISVQMYGVQKGETFRDDVTFSIAAMLCSTFACAAEKSVVWACRQDDSRHCKQYQNESEGEQEEDVVPGYAAAWPIEWSAKEDQTYQDTSDWVQPYASVQVPPISMEWLRENGFAENDVVSVAVEGGHTVSLYEFYARPVRLERKNRKPYNVDDGIQALMEGNESLLERAAVLDGFYAMAENRRPVNDVEIKETLAEDVRVFVICQTQPSRAQYTGAWQRVEVVSAGQFARVRFLDSGGTDTVMYQFLYKMLPDHCDWPAMCGQFCVQGLYWQGSSSQTHEGEHEMSDVADKFRQLLREDWLMEFRILGVYKHAKQIWDSSSPSHLRKDVLLVDSLKVWSADSIDIHTEMIGNGLVKADKDRPIYRNDIEVVP